MQTFTKPQPQNLAQVIRPELELLLCCARVQMTEAYTQKIQYLTQQKLDWQFLIQKANHHKLLPLLHIHLKAVCPAVIPIDARDLIHHLFHLIVQHNMLLAGELVKVLSWLEKHDIVAVPYKGPVLAQSLYGNIALRPSSDLDILVPQADILKAKELLITLGYSPKLKMNNAQEMTYLNSKTEHSYDFVHPEKGITIELHWRVESKYSTVIEPCHFWHQLKPDTFAGVSISNLPPEKWLPILCIHASRHVWERLVWLCDVAELLRKCPNMDWEATLQQAQQLGYQRILLVGLYLAHRLLDADLPPEVMQEIAADRQVEFLAAKIHSNLMRGIDPEQEFLGTTLYQIRVRERPQDKFMYFRSFLHWLMPFSS